MGSKGRHFFADAAEKRVHRTRLEYVSQMSGATLRVFSGVLLAPFGVATDEHNLIKHLSERNETFYNGLPVGIIQMRVGII